MSAVHAGLRNSPEGNWSEGGSGSLSVHLDYEGMDSPAAWAAETYGLHLLGKDVHVLKAVFRSPDATCELLRVSGGNDTLCRAVRNIGFAQDKHNINGHLPMLTPIGLVKTLSCAHSSRQDCGVLNYWYWHSENEPEMLDAWSNDNVRVRLASVLEQLVSQDDHYTEAFIRTLKVAP